MNPKNLKSLIKIISYYNKKDYKKSLNLNKYKKNIKIFSLKIKKYILNLLPYRIGRKTSI